ncbi:MAG TPA: hypothetical protein VGO69_09660 [Pyrinomonadaceae bacterium]|jgi:hypothetical protein|nr:hypothetical protein [Pyrinomonadaceae bacterium]
MSDNPNDQSKWPPPADPQNQDASGQQPSQPPRPQWQPPTTPDDYQPPQPGQVFLPRGYQPPPPGYQQPPPGYQQPPPGYQQGQPPSPYNQQGQPYQNQASTDSNSGVWGWVLFILIFGVGNLILYSTTGWLIIPIPRR